MKTEAEIIAIYVKQYPHLSRLAGQSGQQAKKVLGDTISRLAYPAGISGADALLISKIGLP